MEPVFGQSELKPVVPSRAKVLLEKSSVHILVSRAVNTKYRSSLGVLVRLRPCLVFGLFESNGSDPLEITLCDTQWLATSA
ncbi:hypothetical protein TNCV_3780051 [Trichonephila clavipes]|nr:hypothetical protein TNCV_3780051 [Trichonephila clavipes]